MNASTEMLSWMDELNETEWKRLPLALWQWYSERTRSNLPEFHEKLGVEVKEV